MAAMSMVKTAILNLYKPSQTYPSSLPLRPKVSRVLFTSATRYPQVYVLVHENALWVKRPLVNKSLLCKGRNEADEDGGRDLYSADEAVEEPRDEVRETMDTTNEKTREMKDKATEKAKDMREKTGDKATEATNTAAGAAYDTKEKAKEKLGSMADKAHEVREDTMEAAENMADRTKKQAHGAKEKAKDTTGAAADKTRDAAETAADKTKGMAEKVTETAQSVGEKAKETVQGAWGAAKETTQKIKETVVGKSDDVDLDELLEEHVKKPQREQGEKVMDQEVMDASRRRVEDQDHNNY